MDLFSFQLIAFCPPSVYSRVYKYFYFSFPFWFQFFFISIFSVVSDAHLTRVCSICRYFTSILHTPCHTLNAFSIRVHPLFPLIRIDVSPHIHSYYNHPYSVLSQFRCLFLYSAVAFILYKIEVKVVNRILSTLLFRLVLTLLDLPTIRTILTALFHIHKFHSPLASLGPVFVVVGGSIVGGGDENVQLMYWYFTRY
jgi:hypothetical protein